MKIRSLKISKLYSFGPLQELSEFADFNLFIGPNGSGKTNVLRVLAGLPYDFSSVGTVAVNSSTHTAGVSTRNSTAFIPTFGEMSNAVINQEAWSSNISGELEICYEGITNTTQAAPEAKNISCKDGVDGHMEFISGDIVSYARRIHKVVPPDTGNVFFKQLCLVLGANEIRTDILNLGLFYIFGSHYIFFKNGTFVQGKNTRNGRVEHDYQTLPSGVLQIAKVLTGILEGQDKPVILIDEPELHVEPRHLRAFFEFLVWYCSRSKNIVSRIEGVIVSRVDDALKNNQPYSKVIWERIPKKIGNTLHGKQVFISSHSSVLINEFLKLSDTGSLYEFRLKGSPYKRMDKVVGHYTGNDSTEVNLVGMFTDVRKVCAFSSTILDGLGCKGADLLQCNGVIWVEGPSDVIYIRKWLEIYAQEIDSAAPVQGRDYEFQMFGGTLLDSLCAIKEDLEPEDEIKKLIEMFSFSRNAIVVIDSDAQRDSESGKIFDASSFKAAKSQIAKQFSTLQSQGYNLELWFEEGNANISTIEDYIPENMRENIPKLTKKTKAQRVVDSWGSEVKLSSFNDGLKAQVEKIGRAIGAWTGN